MSSIQLDDEEWQRVLTIIAGAPWNVANPLLLKIGEQLRVQSEQRRSDGPMAVGDSLSARPAESKHN
jgi:hypothetical protein